MPTWTRYVLWAIALFALAGCGSTTEVWKDETIVEEVPTGPAKVETDASGGMLKVTVLHPVRETVRPIVRLHLVHEHLESTVDWELVGLTTLYVLGGVAIALGYGLVYVFIDAVDSEP